MSRIIETRLSDGLKNVRPHEADEIVIAGMGGDLISRIINTPGWFRNYGKRFILQPMSSESVLRLFLAKNGYVIEKEKTVISDSKVYAVMTVLYDGIMRKYDESYFYIGKLIEAVTPGLPQYINKQLKDLHNRALGAKANGDAESELNYLRIIRVLENYLLKFQ